MIGHIKGRYSWLKHMDFIFLDVLALFLAFLGAIYTRNGDFSLFSLPKWKSFLLICSMLDLTVIMFSGMFSGIARRSGSDELIQTIKHALYNAAICGFMFFVFKTGVEYSRAIFAMMYGYYVIICMIFKQAWKAVLRSGKYSPLNKIGKSVLVVSSREDMPAVLRSVNSGFFKEYVVKGVCMTDGVPGESVEARIEVLDEQGRAVEKLIPFENNVEPDKIVDFVLENHIEEVFVNVNPSEISSETYRTLIANGKGIHLDIAQMIGFTPDNQFVTTVGTNKALTVGAYSFTVKQLVYLSFKRVMDFFCGLVGMIPLLPLMLVVKLSYLAKGDKMSIFYTQERVGLNGKTFRMYKFRSMVWNAEEILEELLQDENYRKEWEENQKFEHDPRITTVGNILRKTSLDEVPQFLNLLKGDMSLIGPRPLVVGELEQHNGLQLYNQVKPGITGWWGCNGRSNTTYDERLELEYYYVRHCSFYLDVVCVIKTISALVKREGAK